MHVFGGKLGTGELYSKEDSRTCQRVSLPAERRMKESKRDGRKNVALLFERKRLEVISTALFTS